MSGCFQAKAARGSLTRHPTKEAQQQVYAQLHSTALNHGHSHWRQHQGHNSGTAVPGCHAGVLLLQLHEYLYFVIAVLCAKGYVMSSGGRRLGIRSREQLIWVTALALAVGKTTAHTSDV
jgi:hypothetical protein